MLGYVTKGLVCFYDQIDPDGEICDTNFLLKAEGKVSENVYTCEFCVTRKSDSNWLNVNWNNCPYPFLARENIWIPNAWSTGNGIRPPSKKSSVGIPFTIVTSANGAETDVVYLNGDYSFSQKQSLYFTTVSAVYPKKLNKRSDLAIHCYRLYNRILTAEEIAHNYEIDRRRFGSGNE